MTQGTAQVERLDYIKPPPGFTVFASDNSPVAKFYDPLKEAWASYRARHDPPGIDVARAHGHPIPWWAYRERLCLLGRDSEAEARAAAWAWYDRRLALAHTGVAWPLVLTWSDEVCAAAEANCARFDRIDAVLVGKLPEEALDG